MPINTAMHIANRALLLAQASMEVTAHNMANVNTKGYSRQELELIPSPTYKSAFGEMGSGVSAENISRMYDATLTRNLIRQSSLLAKYETEKSIIWQIETIFNESLDNGLNRVLAEFWNSWQEVANNPEGNPERMSLMENSHALMSTISQMRASLDEQLMDLNLRIKDGVTEVNILVEEIAELNESISRAEMGRFNANDMRDQRDVLLRRLAGLIEITEFEDPRDGSVFVLTPKGFPLVEGNVYWTLSSAKDVAGNDRIYWNRSPDAQVDITDTFDQGQLGGLVKIRQNIIEDFYTQFDAFTAMLIKEVNRQHAQGAGLVHMTDATGTYEVSPFARLETNLAGEDNDIVFTAKNTGTDGDQVTIAFLDPGGLNQPLGVTVVNNDITISLARDSGGNLITTARDIIDFINTDSGAGAAAARALVSVALAQDNDGRGLVSAMEETNLNRHLSNILTFGEDMAAGSFDLITYDASNSPAVNTINVNLNDTREDILAQIGESFATGIAGIRASIVADDSGKEHLRIEADTSNGYDYTLANDTASILMALGLNTFFTGYDTTTIQLNQTIENNLSFINAGMVSAEGETSRGSNVNALTIADLKDRAFLFQNGPSTISEAYNTLAADIGSTAHTIYRNTDFTENLVMQLEQQRDSISAVSIDEELTNMIKFQYAYMAAAKIITTSEEMLQSLISMV